MSEIIFISGGARSGKSNFAEKVAKDYGRPTSYIATSIAFDKAMRERIKRHRDSRPKEWETIETYKDFIGLKDNRSFLKSEVILLDCITLMVTNNMMDSNIDFEDIDYNKLDRLEQKIRREIDVLFGLIRDQDKTGIIVTNEVGFGIVPENRMAAEFRDIAGRINQYIASLADRVYMVYMGIENRIK